MFSIYPWVKRITDFGQTSFECQCAKRLKKKVMETSVFVIVSPSHTQMHPQSKKKISQDFYTFTKIIPY